MALVQKITDPAKMVTDPKVLAELAKQGIDKDFVEFVDYGPRDTSKGISPFTKGYIDHKSKKRIAVVSGLPRCKADGTKLVSRFELVDGTYIADTNLFDCIVDDTEVWVQIGADQPNGHEAGETRTYTPQCFLDDVEVLPKSKTPVLINDPFAPVYTSNVLEWDYGICKRWLRVILGRLQGFWVFDTPPEETVRFKYNQQGDFRLRLGPFAISDDEEEVTLDAFDDMLYKQGIGKYVVDDSDTFYTEVDGGDADDSVVYIDNASDMGWATIHDHTGQGCVANGNAASICIKAGSSSGWRRIYRLLLCFDTSSLPDGCTISSATLSLYGAGKAQNLAGDFDANVVACDPADPANHVAGDYDSVEANVLSDDTLDYSEMSTTGYNDWPLNSSGLAAISKTGITELALREESHDIDDSAPPFSSLKQNHMEFYMADNGSNEPKLMVTYSAGGKNQAVIMV